MDSLHEADQVSGVALPATVEGYHVLRSDVLHIYRA